MTDRETLEELAERLDEAVRAGGDSWYMEASDAARYAKAIRAFIATPAITRKINVIPLKDAISPDYKDHPMRRP